MALNIKVLGGGCANCHDLEANARAAAEQLGVEATVEHSGDRAVYARYGLLATPGLVINDRLVSGGSRAFSRRNYDLSCQRVGVS